MVAEPQPSPKFAVNTGMGELSPVRTPHVEVYDFGFLILRRSALSTVCILGRRLEDP